MKIGLEIARFRIQLKEVKTNKTETISFHGKKIRDLKHLLKETERFVNRIEK